MAGTKNALGKIQTNNRGWMCGSIDHCSTHTRSLRSISQSNYSQSFYLCRFFSSSLTIYSVIYCCFDYYRDRIRTNCSINTEHLFTFHFTWLKSSYWYKVSALEKAIDEELVIYINIISKLILSKILIF